MKEIWKPIKDYEGLYEVSNFGVVRSLDRTVIVNRLGKKVERRIRGTNLKTAKTTGYHIVSLCKNSVLKTGLLHRIIAEAFIPNPENKPFINHIDNNGLNNDLSNIEWCTAMENSAHCKKQGRNKAPRGDNHPTTKLKEKEVREVKEMIRKGFRVTDIARMYGVRQPLISEIKSGKTYKYIT